MFDIVNSGSQDAFVNGGHAAFHFLRVHARVVPHHGDYRNVDIGEDVGGSSQDDDRADNENQQRQDDESVRPMKCYSNDPHNVEPLPELLTSMNYETDKSRNTSKNRRI